MKYHPDIRRLVLLHSRGLGFDPGRTPGISAVLGRLVWRGVPDQMSSPWDEDGKHVGPVCSWPGT